MPKERVTIYLAANTFVYLPIYIADKSGIFNYLCKGKEYEIILDLPPVEKQNDVQCLEFINDKVDDLAIAVAGPLALYHENINKKKEDFRVLGALIRQPCFWLVDHDCPEDRKWHNLSPGNALVGLVEQFKPAHHFSKKAQLKDSVCGNVAENNIHDVSLGQELLVLTRLIGDLSEANDEVHRPYAITPDLLLMAAAICKSDKVKKAYSFSLDETYSNYLTTCLITKKVFVEPEVSGEHWWEEAITDVLTGIRHATWLIMAYQNLCIYYIMDIANSVFLPDLKRLHSELNKYGLLNDQANGEDETIGAKEAAYIYDILIGDDSRKRGLPSEFANFMYSLNMRISEEDWTQTADTYYAPARTNGIAKEELDLYKRDFKILVTDRFCNKSDMRLVESSNVGLVIEKNAPSDKKINLGSTLLGEENGKWKNDFKLLFTFNLSLMLSTISLLYLLYLNLGGDDTLNNLVALLILFPFAFFGVHRVFRYFEEKFERWKQSFHRLAIILLSLTYYLTIVLALGEIVNKVFGPFNLGALTEYFNLIFRGNEFAEVINIVAILVSAVSIIATIVSIVIAFRPQNNIKPVLFK
jgi:hypothetical protein